MILPSHPGHHPLVHQDCELLQTVGRRKEAGGGVGVQTDAGTGEHVEVPQDKAEGFSQGCYQL